MFHTDRHKSTQSNIYLVEESSHWFTNLYHNLWEKNLSWIVLNILILQPKSYKPSQKSPILFLLIIINYKSNNLIILSSHLQLQAPHMRLPAWRGMPCHPSSIYWALTRVLLLTENPMPTQLNSFCSSICDTLWCKLSMLRGSLMSSLGHFEHAQRPFFLPEVIFTMQPEHV